MDHRSGNFHQRILSFAERHPAGYRFIVLVVGTLGYVYLAVTALLVVATTSGLVFLLVDLGFGPQPLLVSLPVLLLVLLLISALRTPAWPARGYFVARGEATPLYALVESVRARIGAPDIRSLQLDASFEVSVVRMPRLASLLGFRTHLVLGLPLMLAMPLPQFRALLAHELAHHRPASRADGARVYRLRDRWLQLNDALSAARHPATVLMRAFFRWYSPRFAALSFAVARRHEFAADRLAATATSREDLAHALVRRAVVEQYLEDRLYPQLLADVRGFGVPPSGLQRRFTRSVHEIRTDRRFAAWLAECLSRDAFVDTHASIADRLRALGLPEGWISGRGAYHEAAFAPELIGDSAARHCLGSVSSELLLSIEHAWIEDVMRAWADRHEELKSWDERRRELDSRPDLSPGETLELAISTSAIEGTDAALPILRGLVTRQPDMAPARFVLGTLLLRRNDEEGLHHLQAALAMDAELIPDGCRFVREYLGVNGDRADAIDFLDRFESARDADPVEEADEASVIEKAVPVAASGACGAENDPCEADRHGDRTRTQAQAPDSDPEMTSAPAEPVPGRGDGAGSGFSPHGLDYAQALTVKRGIAPVAAVARAYLVRETATAPLYPAGALTVPIHRAGGEAAGRGSRFVLAVELMRGDHDSETVAARLAADVQLPGPGVVVVLSRRHRRLRRAITALDQTPLFERTRRRAA